MGQSKTGGFTQVPTFSQGQNTLLDQVMQFAQSSLQGQGLGANPNYAKALESTSSFLPGGSGFTPISNAAHRDFREQTLPSILNAYGSNAKSSSALNQALAHAGTNLNTNLAAQQSQNALQASNQLGNLAAQPYQQGLVASQQGLSAQPFALTPEQTPFWQTLINSLISGGSKVAGSYLGRP